MSSAARKLEPEIPRPPALSAGADLDDPRLEEGIARWAEWFDGLPSDEQTLIVGDERRPAG